MHSFNTKISVCCQKVASFPGLPLPFLSIEEAGKKETAKGFFLSFLPPIAKSGRGRPGSKASQKVFLLRKDCTQPTT